MPSSLGPTLLDTPCIPWQATIGSHGYGMVKGDRLAHRVAYAVCIGPIPPRTMVLHKCDNPPCINPDHLFLGDHASNARDMVAKGRHRGGARKGERNHFAKLSDADVIRLRADRELGMTQRALAHKYGVGQAQVWRILHGECRG